MIDVVKTPLEEIFGYNTKQSELIEVCKYIKKTFIKPNYSSIPKEYYPFLYKLLSYRKFDYRGKYKEGDIRTFYVGKDEYNNNSIAFFDISGKHDFIGSTNAIKEWQNEKDNEWENMLRCVTNICRNLIMPIKKQLLDSTVFPIECPINKTVIKDKSECHIDHYDDDFSKVLFDWLYNLKKWSESKNNKLIDIVKIIYDMREDDECKRFKAEKFNESFINWHNSHTHLRIISIEANRKREKYHPNWNLLKINGKYIENYEQKKSY